MVNVKGLYRRLRVFRLTGLDDCQTRSQAKFDFASKPALTCAKLEVREQKPAASKLRRGQGKRIFSLWPL